MSDNQVEIRIPDNPTQDQPTSVSSTKQFQNQTENRFRSIDNLLYAIVVAIVISAISALITVGGIVIDQLHFNNQTYRDTKQEFQIFSQIQIEMQQIRNDIDALQETPLNPDPKVSN